MSMQKFGPPAKGGGRPLTFYWLYLHRWLVERSFGLSSNCYFATELAPELLDILWPITLEVITLTIVVPLCGCGAAP